MSFKKKSYLIISEAIPPYLASFLTGYFLLKRRVVGAFLDSRYISPFVTEWGTWTDKQVPKTYSQYADIAMENLLQMTRPLMEQKTGLKLVPTYSYARIYKRGDILPRHKDREACEISTTLFLGGIPWPIFIEPNSKKGKETVHGYISSNTKGLKVILKPGDMLIYKGCELEHWREAFQGDYCVQVFLHYNRKGKNDNEFDGRPFLGLPNTFRKNK
tara:strand:+ start:605 stop:1252 length:648 start_codon:yes stop_codon:yes gene_type:complete